MGLHMNNRRRQQQECTETQQIAAAERWLRREDEANQRMAARREHICRPPVCVLCGVVVTVRMTEAERRDADGGRVPWV